MPTLCDLLNSFNQALVHEGSDWREQMEGYHQNRRAWNQDFYKTPINQPEIQSSVNALLDHLQLPTQQKSRYFGVPLTVYELIQELRRLPLSEHHNLMLHDLLNEIEKPTRDRRNAILQMAAIFLAGASIFMVEGGLSVVQSILSMTAVMPILSMVYTLGIAVYSFYDNQHNDELSFYDLFRMNFFLFSYSALKITSYSFLLVAAATLAPVAAALSIAAELMLVVQAGLDLAFVFRSKKSVGDILPTDDLDVRHKKVRGICLYEKKQNMMWIELGTSVVVTAAIITMILFPGLGVAAAALAAIGLSYFGRFAVHSWNEKRAAHQLEKSFLRVEEQWEQTHSPELHQALEKTLEGGGELAPESGNAPRSRQVISEGFFERKRAAPNPLDRGRVIPENISDDPGERGKPKW